MAVHSLFQPTDAERPREAMVALTDDIGRLPRERRLALYLGACQALGLEATRKPLRYIRCDDGSLRLSIAAGAMESLPGRMRQSRALTVIVADRSGAAHALQSGRKSGRRARLTLLRSDARKVVRGGITYDIDLNSGELAVEGVLRSDGAAGFTPECVPPGYDRMAG